MAKDLPPAFLEHTKDLWQSAYAHQLTDEDAREITTNLTALFDILEEWDCKQTSLDHNNQQTNN